MKNELVFFPRWVAGRGGYADRIRELFEEYHKAKGLRLTPQRTRILDTFLKTNHHLGQEELYLILKHEGIGFVTIFRTLKMMEEANILTKVISSDGKAKYEVNYERPHHDHLICIECGTIKEVRWPLIEKIQQKECRKLGFKPTFHRHEVFGRCKSCQERVKSR